MAAILMGVGAGAAKVRVANEARIMMKDFIVSLTNYFDLGVEASCVDIVGKRM
jgi:hypothetical protein